jgi:hypothetical protein
VVESYVARLRAGAGGRNPSEAISTLNKQYLLNVTVAGASAGAAAVAPGVGTVAATGLNIAEVGWFLESTVLYVMATANVHGVRVDDPERRRALIGLAILGQSAANGVLKGTGKTAPHLAKQIITKIPMSQIDAINRVLGPRFVTKWGTKQGILVLGREMPLGIGAAIGGSANLGLAYATIKSTAKLFDKPPTNWPDGDLRRIESTPDD